MSNHNWVIKINLLNYIQRKKLNTVYVQIFDGRKFRGLA